LRIAKKFPNIPKTAKCKIWKIRHGEFPKKLQNTAQEKKIKLKYRKRKKKKKGKIVHVKSYIKLMTS